MIVTLNILVIYIFASYACRSCIGVQLTRNQSMFSIVFRTVIKVATLTIGMLFLRTTRCCTLQVPRNLISCGAWKVNKKNTGELNVQLHAKCVQKYYDHTYFVLNHAHFCTIEAAIAHSWLMPQVSVL